MTVKLTGNFLATARCLIFQDSGSGTWTFDPTTNELTISAAGGSTGSGNPTATIGLTAVDGSATTWMTSDSAPALSSSIYSSLNVVSTLCYRDSNGNVHANNFESAIQGNAATGTITLTNASARIQTFTSGSGSAIVILPDATTLHVGHTIELDNNATGNLTVQLSGTGTTFLTMLPGSYLVLQCTSISFPAGQWNYYWTNPATNQGLVQDSIVLSSGVAQLSGDSASPGNSYFYGTNGSGTKGWYASSTVTQSVGANPSATVGLSAVNGSATTFMRSDAAPGLSQAIVPTWTGAHTWSALGTFNDSAAINAASNVQALTITGFGGTSEPLLISAAAGQQIANFDTTSTSGGYVRFSRSGAYKGFIGDAAALISGTLDDFALRAANRLCFGAGGANQYMILSTAGTLSITGALGWNGATPPAQTTGWGTPTGNSVQANFAGASAALTTCSAAIAEILTIMKAHGMIGA